MFVDFSECPNFNFLHIITQKKDVSPNISKSQKNCLECKELLVYNSIFHSENNLRFNGELIAYSVDPSVHHTSGMKEGGIVQNTSHNGTKYF